MTRQMFSGFANVHSHAFQRGLRGQVQSRNPQSTDTFWTWREAMYGLANQVDLPDIEALARLCYTECLESGYTALGEFHYLHHGKEGKHWADPMAASHAIIRAAKQTGIRLTLLWTVYARGGFDTALSEKQQRFGSKSLDDVRRALDAISPHGDGSHINLGLAIHSVRAVPRDWLRHLADEALARNMVLHAHVSEQPAEVDACRQATGLSPVALLAEQGVLDTRFTAVHGTWLDDEDVRLLAKHDVTVALCPSTEGDLGDGVPRTKEMHDAGISLCIGSDSHAVIDPFTELRMMEYQARAATGSRCVLIDQDGKTGPCLTNIGHRNGYEALGLKPGEDTFNLRENATALQRTGDPLATLWSAGNPGLVDEVYVGGRKLVENGVHMGR